MGGRRSTCKVIYQSLKSQLGTAYDTEDSSNVCAELLAEARCIQSIWLTSERLANNFDPLRMTDYLSRWETITGQKPQAADSGQVRRARVAAEMATIAGATTDIITKAASSSLGNLFVAIEYTPIASNSPHWSGTGEPLAWRSNLANVVVRVKHPANMTNAEFYRRCNGAIIMLYDLLPSWTTVIWGVFSSAGVAGFLLDEPDLDLETFDG